MSMFSLTEARNKVISTFSLAEARNKVISMFSLTEARDKVISMFPLTEARNKVKNYVREPQRLKSGIEGVQRNRTDVHSDKPVTNCITPNRWAKLTGSQSGRTGGRSH